MVRMMGHWYKAEHRGNVMGLVGTCYQFGGAFASLLALFLTGYYVTHFHGDWRIAFWRRPCCSPRSRGFLGLCTQPAGRRGAAAAGSR